MDRINGVVQSEPNDAWNAVAAEIYSPEQSAAQQTAGQEAPPQPPQAKPTETKPTQVKPVAEKPADTLAAQSKPVEAKPVPATDSNPAQVKPAGEKPSAMDKPGDAKPLTDKPRDLEYYRPVLDELEQRRQQAYNDKNWEKAYEAGVAMLAVRDLCGPGPVGDAARLLHRTGQAAYLAAIDESDPVKKDSWRAEAVEHLVRAEQLYRRMNRGATGGDRSQVHLFLMRTYDAQDKHAEANTQMGRLLGALRDAQEHRPNSRALLIYSERTAFSLEIMNAANKNRVPPDIQESNLRIAQEVGSRAQTLRSKQDGR